MEWADIGRMGTGTQSFKQINMAHADDIIQLFRFVEDKTKRGRVLSMVKIGGVYMSRLVISPGVTTGNYYHKKTKIMFYVGRGKVKAVFEQVKTKKRKELIMDPGKHVVHLPSHVALATKNIGKQKAVVVYFSNHALRDSKDAFPYHVM